MFTIQKLQLMISRKIKLLFLFGLIILALNLWLDFKILNWYSNFYQSIIQKNITEFGFNALQYIIISSGIAICMSLFSLVSEYLDLELKVKFSMMAGHQLHVAGLTQNSNQKLIDDATLAAEKFSILLPMYIFNSIKALATIIAITYWTPNSIKIVYINTTIYYPLLFASVFFIIIQTWISRKYYPIVTKTDKLRRRAENTFRMKVINGTSITGITSTLNSYLRAVSLIRIFSAKKNFFLSVLISVLSALSYVIPFCVLFSLYYFNEMSFGDLMRVSATFGFFQNATNYLLMNNKELSRGIAAYKRILFS